MEVNLRRGIAKSMYYEEIMEIEADLYSQQWTKTTLKRYLCDKEIIIATDPLGTFLGYCIFEQRKKFSHNDVLYFYILRRLAVVESYQDCLIPRILKSISPKGRHIFCTLPLYDAKLLHQYCKYGFMPVRTIHDLFIVDDGVLLVFREVSKNLLKSEKKPPF